MNVDAFLAYYFRQHERRSSPRALSYDGIRATSREADLSNAKYTWAIGVLGSMERAGSPTRRQIEVLRAYFLSLANHHLALVHDRFGTAHVRRRHVDAGERVPVDDDEVADLVSWVSWPKMAELFGYKRGNRHAVAALKDDFRAGRAAIRNGLTNRQEHP